MIRVFLLDDHELVRRGLAEIVNQEEDLEIVGEAETARDALARVPAVRPDVAVLDVRLPDGNGIEVCREIRSRQPEVRCLFVTSYAEEEGMSQAIMAGAAGYLIKQAKGPEIVDAIRRVAAGQSLLDPTLMPKLLERMRGPASDPLAHLTEQEHRVLDLIAEGLTNREIAQRLYLSEKTVRNYVSSVLKKLGMKHRTQAALYAAGMASRKDPPPEAGPGPPRVS